MHNEVVCVNGSSNQLLAAAIANESGYATGKVEIQRFSDGETSIEIMSSVREATVVVVQSTSAPANESLMELMLMVDALKRASAGRIIAAMPYFGYARQDRRPGFRRMPITARVVADMLQTVGVDHLITVDLHATQIQGFFTIPVDNITAMQVFADDIHNQYRSTDDVIVVSPDVGGVARARMLSKALGDVDMAIVDKRRPKANVSEVMNVIGDVNNRTCILVDDMIDTAGTICHAATALMERGAKRVVAYATHGVLSGAAYQNILKTDAMAEIVVTNSISRSTLQTNRNTNVVANCPKIRELSISKLLSDTIRRVTKGGSIQAALGY